MRRLIVITIVISTLIASCTLQDTPKLKEGVWRGELAVQDKWTPFIFEVKTMGNDSVAVVLRNGDERVELSNVTFSNDSVTIPIEAYDAFIRAKLNGKNLEGRFLKNYIENDQGVPFRAEFNQTDRFPVVSNPSEIRIDGKWDIHFVDEKSDTTRNVGVFKTDNNTVTGSVLTNAGDLRFLEGNYTDTGVQLSAFSGLSPYLIEISFRDNDNFDGQFYTTRGITKLIGVRNDQASLADPYTLTNMKPGYESLHFSLPNLDGELVSVDDNRYKDKVVIVSILGSWCPNCLDEMEYLSPWYKENKNRGVEIIGLAFERKDDLNYAKSTLSRLINKYNVDYEILFAGQLGDATVQKVLPEIDKLSSYPTTFFIDKKGKVRKIHTGFTGPATGLFYEEFKKDFNSLIDSLLLE
ncbi:MAG: Thiol-disulfide oxidoreductase ResA [Petrimonas sp.]|jgi:thiol-disulfide isomerase/thioredoxin|uniref:TlpA disulfide reductase family protein n=1 Tax=Petrimonas sp. TaxID=2023866 RepID=UPI0030D06C67